MRIVGIDTKEGYYPLFLTHVSNVILSRVFPTPRASLAQAILSCEKFLGELLIAMLILCSIIYPEWHCQDPAYPTLTNKLEMAQSR